MDIGTGLGLLFLGLPLSVVFLWGLIKFEIHTQKERDQDNKE